MVPTDLIKGLSDRSDGPLHVHEALYLNYLRFWARFVVRRRGPTVIGITGSVGKTTTKEVVAAVLREAEPSVGLTWATPGNMNNEWGVALTLLGYRRWAPRRDWELGRALSIPLRALRMATWGRYPRVLVLEVGAEPGGRTERALALAPPDVGVVTTVGAAHLSKFRTVETVAEIKGAIVRAVPPTGLVILGSDNAVASAMSRYAQAPVVKVSGKGKALSEAIARVVADHLGVPSVVVDRALAKGVTVRGRQEEIDFRGGTLVNDAFNANPLSMAYGLETLAERARPGQRRVAVLGEMAELGDEEARYHREVAPAARACADVVVGVGPLARLYEPDHWFESSEACAEALPALLHDGDYILVKGSHSSHLSVVVKALKRGLGPAPSSAWA